MSWASRTAALAWAATPQSRSELGGLAPLLEVEALLVGELVGLELGLLLVGEGGLEQQPMEGLWR